MCSGPWATRATSPRASPTPPAWNSPFPLGSSWGHLPRAEYVEGFLFLWNPHPFSTCLPRLRSQSTTYTPSLLPALNSTFPNWSQTNEPPQKSVLPSLPTLFTAQITRLFVMAWPTWTASHAFCQSPSDSSIPLTLPIAVG